MSDYSSTYPTQSPVFAFDAKAGKLDSRISYSRASTGTYLSNEKALSSENLLLQSQDFDTTWTVNHMSAPTGSQTAPDASSTAWLLSAASGTGAATIAQNASPRVSSNTSYTLVCHVKAGTASHAYISFRGAPTESAYAMIDFASPLSPTSGGSVMTGISSSSVALGNSWYRLSLTFTTATISGGYSFIYVGTSDGTLPTSGGYVSYDSTGDTLYAWGAQLSSTNSKVYDSPTTTQISREYSPLLKTASADAPRFEYSATDGQSEGLLIEAQSSNLFARSSGFDYTSAWTKTNVTASAEAIAPDGTLNAFAIRENTTSGTFKRIHQAATVAAGSVAVSVYAKLLGNERRLVIREDSATGDSAVFDLSSGTVAATNVGGAGTIKSVGNGWYRCTLITSPSGSPGYQFGFWLATATGTTTESYTGDGYSGVLLFGAMCENASAPSSYVESLASTTTRAADSCSVALSDINFTGGEVTLVADTNTSAIDDYRQAASIIDDSQNQVTLYGNSYNNRLAAISGGGENSTLSQTSANGISALSFGVNDIAATRNGASPVTDTSQAFPDVSAGNLKIGGSGSSQILNGTIKRVALYNVALSDTELQAITS